MWILNNWTRAIPKAVACIWDTFYKLGCLVWPQWERKLLALQRLELPRLSPTQLKKNRRERWVRIVGGGHQEGGSDLHIK